MSVEELSVGESVGVLVDDPACGRLMLDCGPQVATAAAFAGVSLATVGAVLLTTEAPDQCDPAVRIHHPQVIGPADVAAGAALPPAVAALTRRDGGLAWLVRTTGAVLLHHTSPTALTDDALAQIPPGVTLTRPLRGEALAQLAPLRPQNLPTHKRILITGGARSGKSTFAENMLGRDAPALYLATGPVAQSDTEWGERVRQHQQRRPPTWQTVESTDVAAVLSRPDRAPVLLDCLGTWLTAMLEQTGMWEPDERARLALTGRTDELLHAWSSAASTVIAVTNEVGSGVVPATASGRTFRDELGRLNAAIAQRSDEVWLFTCGVGQRLR